MIMHTEGGGGEKAPWTITDMRVTSVLLVKHTIDL